MSLSVNKVQLYLNVINNIMLQHNKSSFDVKPVDEVKIKGIQRVEIIDVQMPFFSMMIFLIKLVLASIPAAIILGILFSVFGGLLFSFF